LRPSVAIIFVAIGVATFLLTYLTNLLWIVVGERITKRLRLQFMNAVLHQEGAFFDKTQSGILVSRLSADIILVQGMFKLSSLACYIASNGSSHLFFVTGGVSEKLGQIFYYAAQVIGGLIVAFVYGWKMTLVMLATAPVMVVVGGIQSMVLTAKSKNAQDAYAEANDIASESFSGVKTVYSFVSEKKMVDRYDENLSNAYKVGIKRAHFTGAGSGFAFFFMFAVYGYDLFICYIRSRTQLLFGF
jgi:ABC-type multidrug transport system fused ATPase/permease subunit